MNNTKNNNPIDDLLDGFFNTSISDIIGADFVSNKPPANITETDEAFHIEIAAPGFNKSDFNIEVVNDHIEVKVNEATDGDVTENATSYTRREFDFSSFTRKFKISDKIDRTSISATYVDGILNIALAKIEPSEEGPRSIQID